MTIPTARTSRSRLRLPILLALVAAVGAGFASWRNYSSPSNRWRRSIHSADPKARADAWRRVQSDREIPGLDRVASTPEIFGLLEDPDPEVRLRAVTAITALEPAAVEAIARLSGRLYDPDLKVRAKAASAIGEVFRRDGPGREEGVAALTVALKDERPEVRSSAVAALGQVVFESGRSTDPLRCGRGDDPALDLVADRLVDDDVGVRVEAAYVLACNDRGEQAVPFLADLIRKQAAGEPPTHAEDRAYLAMMVLAVRSDEAAAFLGSEMALARDGDPDRPRDALAWAARQTSEARQRVKRVATQALVGADPSFRHGLALLLHEIGSDQAALPLLIEALGDRSAATRGKAVEALADVGNADPRVVPSLQLATSDPDAEVRERAFAALEAIEWDEALSGMDGEAP